MIKLCRDETMPSRAVSFAGRARRVCEQGISDPADPFKVRRENPDIIGTDAHDPECWNQIFAALSLPELCGRLRSLR
jgi:hypothetical protein